jgi:transcriptional regulator with XRE-family HTH domain
VPAKPSGPTRLPASDNVRDVFAYQIRLLRVEKGWSQERLALECGLDRTYVSAVERSTWNIALGNIERLALALGVEVWTLLKPPEGAKPAPLARSARKSSVEAGPKLTAKAPVATGQRSKTPRSP